jgi:hypothetical protein
VHEPRGCVSFTLDLLDHRMIAGADGKAWESVALEAVGGTFCSGGRSIWP